MIEWQETVKRAYDLGSRQLGAPACAGRPDPKKRLVRLAFGTHTLQVQWEKDETMELRVSEPGVPESQTARLSLRLANQFVNGVVVTRQGQTEQELKALLDELLDKWQVAEGKLN